jgi:L-asparaginase
MSTDNRPLVVIIPTGGTIAHLPRHRLDHAEYSDYGTFMEGDALLARLPELNEIAEITLHPHSVLTGPRLGLDDLVGVARTVQAVADEQIPAGIVITRGTSTLEETAFMLSLTIRRSLPVVLTAAMRPADSLSEDGSLNLVNAVRTAASAAARDLGVVVVMNDRIFAARDVTKGAGYRTDAFVSRDLGPLGYAEPDGTILIRHHHTQPPPAQSPFDASALGSLPRVEVVVSYVGADGMLIDAAVSQGAAGIVSAGFGAGKPTALEEAALDRAIEAGVVVVQASRVGTGRVIRRESLRSRDIVAAGDLLPWKARILLALALTTTRDPDQIQALFDRY